MCHVSGVMCRVPGLKVHIKKMAGLFGGGSVVCGSYELLLSNVAHQMKEKYTIQNKFSYF